VGYPIGKKAMHRVPAIRPATRIIRKFKVGGGTSGENSGRAARQIDRGLRRRGDSASIHRGRKKLCTLALGNFLAMCRCSDAWAFLLPDKGQEWLIRALC